MDNLFKIIAVTPPDFSSEEADIIIRILKNKEADIVHIRKPGANVSEISQLLNQIPSEFHPNLKLHDGFELLNYYNLGGVHLNSRNSKIPANAVSISKSAHSYEELKEANEFDYMTLSPIFDSISKREYKSNFNLSELIIKLKPYSNIVALGGITPEFFPLLIKTGFAGAALLGYFFHIDKNNNI